MFITNIFFRRSMRKSFRKSLDKIVNKRENLSREHSIESAYSGKDDDSIMSNSMEIIDEKNDQQKKPESPLLANPNLMLELNAKIGRQRISSELSEKSGTPPPIPSSPKPAFNASPSSQEQKRKSKIPRFSRSDSLGKTETVDDSGPTVNNRKVSTSKIPKMISVKSSPTLISPITVKSENQILENRDSVDKIEELKTVQKTRDQEDDNQSEGSIIQPGSKCDELSGEGVKENKTKKLSSRIRPQAKLMSSPTIPKSQNYMSSEENLIQSNKTENKNPLLPDTNKLVDVTNEEKRNSRRSSIPKLMSIPPKVATLPIPEDPPRPVSLPTVMGPSGKVPENKETSSETVNIGLSLPPRARKLSDSKIPQPVDFKNKSEDLKPATANAKTSQNKDKDKEELNDSKVSTDDKITNQQMETKDGNDSKDPVVLKIPGTKKRSSMILDDASSEFQKETKLSDEKDKE